MNRKSQIRVLRGLADVRIYSDDSAQATNAERNLMSELFGRIAIEATRSTLMNAGVKFCFIRKDNIGRKLIACLGQSFGTLLSMIAINDQVPTIIMHEDSISFVPQHTEPEDYEDRSRDTIFLISPDGDDKVNGFYTITEFMRGVK